jgi:hypothetical protein
MNYNEAPLVCRRQSFPYALLTPYQISLTPACLLATDCYVPVLYSERGAPAERSWRPHALSLQDGTTTLVLCCSAALSLSLSPNQAPHESQTDEHKQQRSRGALQTSCRQQQRACADFWLIDTTL